MIVGAIGHEVSRATPVMPVLRAYRACASPSIVLKPRSTTTRRHELLSGAAAIKIAFFDHWRPANPRGSCAVPVALGNTQTIAKFLCPTSSYRTAHNILSSLLSKGARRCNKPSVMHAGLISMDVAAAPFSAKFVESNCGSHSTSLEFYYIVSTFL